MIPWLHSWASDISTSAVIQTFLKDSVWCYQSPSSVKPSPRLLRPANVFSVMSKKRTMTENMDIFILHLFFFIVINVSEVILGVNCNLRISA